ncbi:MAG: sensor histidine kinase [Chloroflexota bacterium]
MEIALALLLLLAVIAVVRLEVVGRRDRRELDAIRHRLGVGGVEGAAELAVGRLEQRSTAVAAEREELAAEAAFVRGFVDVGLIKFDRDRRVTLANPPAHALLARAPGTLNGRTVLETFLDRRAEAVVAAAGGGEPASAELAPDGPDGRRLLVRGGRSPAGSIWLVLADVTELRRLQQIRAEFVDNISHELRTPLSSVSLLAETLAAEADAAGVPPRIRERITKIEVETGHLVQMVNELLDLARIEGGGAVAVRDGVDLGALAARTTERMRLFAERQGVRLTVDVEPDLPRITGDEQRLGQVLLNLVHNAVKFSPDGGDVTVRARRETGGVMVSVEDHGIGIAKADRQRVFERFYKVDRARSPSGGGTGLGLSIARNVIEQHRGRIWVDSREGRGSTFSFVIPTDDSVRSDPLEPVERQTVSGVAR